MNVIVNTRDASVPAPTGAAPAPNQAGGAAQQLFAALLDPGLPSLPPEPVAGSAPDADQARQGAQPTADHAEEDAPAALPDAALLAAMAMPLMPLSPAQVVQALQAAQPESGTAACEDTAVAATVGPDDGGRAGLPLPLPAAIAPAAASTPAATLPIEAAAARPALDADQPASDSDAGQPSAQGGQVAAPLLAGSATPAATPAPDTVKLAGPPSAWRQSLQEALGERLNLQVGRNVEQAVIRLDPPQLGRIDIAIRHSAGALEVSISASNGEVLRQLQGVSDNLRSELSQRQFSEVAVTVAPAPKSQAAPFGDPQQQGRQRQPGREQDEQEIGTALAEAGRPGTVFTLN